MKNIYHGTNTNSLNYHELKKVQGTKNKIVVLSGSKIKDKIY